MKLKDPIHCMPMDDIIEHIESPECPCLPFIDPENERDVRQGEADCFVYVHNLVRKSKQEMN
ncbi:MAG TPA: hypothetical protein VFF49_04885 [Thermodesulfobacteriota bacterium]|nr:hypothetical protein [Thermodesulfobacteriota bacterium]